MTRKTLWHWLSIFGYILTYSFFFFLREGTLIFLRPQCPVTRTHLRQTETESYNILNCSNDKIIYGNGLFCHNKWVAKRQDHRNLEFHIVHLLEPAPQTQTATAHLQTTLTVYFDGQGTRKLPCGKIPRGRGVYAGSWSMSCVRLAVRVCLSTCLSVTACLTAAYLSAWASACPSTCLSL